MVEFNLLEQLPWFLENFLVPSSPQGKGTN